MKNNRIILAIVVTAAVLLGAGCKKKQQAPPEPIYQYYQVRYYPEQNTTSADANFYYSRLGGQPVNFISTDGVKANGKTLNVYAIEGDGSYFGWTMDGTPDVVFTFARNDGTILTNKADGLQPGDLTLVIDSVLQVSDTMHINWTGSPLRPGELVNVTMTRLYATSDSANLYSRITTDFFDGGHVCTLDYAQTSLFHPGTYNVELTKRRTTDLQQPDGTAGGKMEISVSVARKVVVK